MLPDRSTDSSRSRPVIGNAIGSPTNCGRAAASTARIQTAPERREPPFRAAPGARNPARSANSAATGTLSAASRSSASARTKRRTSHGSGNAAQHPAPRQRPHGQAPPRPRRRRLRPEPCSAERRELERRGSLDAVRARVRRREQRLPRPRAEIGRAASGCRGSGASVRRSGPRRRARPPRARPEVIAKRRRVVDTRCRHATGSAPCSSAARTRVMAFSAARRGAAPVVVTAYEREADEHERLRRATNPAPAATRRSTPAGGCREAGAG